MYLYIFFTYLNIFNWIVKIQYVSTKTLLETTEIIMRIIAVRPPKIANKLLERNHGVWRRFPNLLKINFFSNTCETV